MKPGTEVLRHRSRVAAAAVALAAALGSACTSSPPPAAAPPPTEAAAVPDVPTAAVAPATPTSVATTVAPAPATSMTAATVPAPLPARKPGAPPERAVAPPPLQPAEDPPPVALPPATLAAAEPPAVPLPPAERAFVPSRTVVENVRPIGRDLDKFDTRGLLIRRAPEVLGRLEFEVEPARVDAGQPYAVKVYLVNEGKKEIKLDDVGVITFVDTQRSTRSVKARTGKAEPGQRVLVTEMNEKAAETFWAVEVTVISKRKDVYRNKLVWK